MKARGISSLALLGALCVGAYMLGASSSVQLAAQNENVASPVYPQFSFTRNMALGQTLEDIRQLQIFLNRDPDTQIALAGPGSPGNESTYFGLLTKNAVVRFQEKYRSEILTPAGLAYGTGYVGDGTRRKLNTLITAAAAPTTTGNSTAPSVPAVPSTIPNDAPPLGAQPLQQQKMPLLFSALPVEVSAGDTVKLLGLGFDGVNTVHIGSEEISDAEAQDGSNMEIEIPESLGNGEYEIWIENSHGSTENSEKKIKILVTDDPQEPPTITSVSPSVVSMGQKITVRGSGFSSSGNDIVSGFGTIESVNSSGTEITFNPSSFEMLNKNEWRSKVPKGVELPIDFYVSNEHGVSAIAGRFKLKL
jgi:hypothetical protein